MISANWDLYRDVRDAAREAAFFQVYGSILSLSVADQRAETRRDAKFDPREVPAVRQVLDTLDVGGLAEGITRMALLIAKAGGGTRDLSQMARARELLASIQGLKTMSEDELRRLLHEETIVTEFEAERARNALPRLIRGRADRKVARTFLDQLETHWPLNDRQRALLAEFRRVLPLPSASPPSAAGNATSPAKSAAARRRVARR